MSVTYPRVNGVPRPLSTPSDGVATLLNNAGDNFSRLQFGGTTSSYPALKRDSAGLRFRLADDSADTYVTAARFAPTAYQITNGSGTGITVDSNSGQIARTVYKVTIAKEAFTAANTTETVTIATLPAKTLVMGCIADMTVVFALAGSQLTITVGNADDADGYLASFDADAATGQFGDANAELGVLLNHTAAGPFVAGGALASWSATKTVTITLTSSVGNLGNGAATSLTTGSITIYLITERLP